MPRLSRYWSLDYVGPVRKVSLRDREFFFSEKFILPFCTSHEIWILHDPDKTQAITEDPDILARVITSAHAEI